ncbi:MAG: TPP-dependent acetoin dehydrogenase complex, E1 protein subunit beta [Patescibacteria group bacterium]|jgi:pyruvate dehydrogenase E1 component beta subunit|uniref:Transketolase central region n=1 Tax=Chloroflexus aurantiacus (strain ATCC 29366 / DSM 635 / J-10-fl) TaxID=324602 RepID=A9W9S6_CHLAA|nr:alpha-ketoacid dehydrogenase subunit beta [Chloroflexus aurantiacus]RMG01879.1 MAG: alpha-ketoacid dehydrogenase subunit beta [Acidobacteriota bacterium]GIV93939.1 MAG: TPP-dependent acetoin dehydrogenase complex, E1 protein subunit beta [Chloroflexus sp.]GIW60965.1 MAG: TPP-dependent acetoin dehydrogenase complex, E1 protein subunit beta [Patescibacteria group bacterium]ABY34562.1 Transketolase central region [Chloroflexus aurantiacus J-10-fl]HBW66855.1 alpha-ketoacid dehydrogenase subunit
MREITYVEAIREALRQKMKEDETVFLIGEDIGLYGGAFGATAGLIEEFGEDRVIDTPISEAGIAGACIGAALTGFRPVGEIQFMDFVTLSMEQLVLQAAKIRFMFGGKASVPFVLRMPGGAGTGAAAQHSESLENWFVHIPGLKVVMPATPYDAKGLLIASIEDNNPVIFIEHKLLYKTKGVVPEDIYRVPLGKSHVVRQGRDVTIVATSVMVQRALEAAEQLAREGIEAEIIDPRTLRPLDDEPILESVVKTGKVLIVHEAVKMAGFGGEIAARIAESTAFDYLEAPICRLGGLDIPIPYNRTLEYHAVPQIENIIAAARDLVALRV